ncbi:phosphoribosyl ATP pyrophosphatase [Acetobacter estunensis NRIC 0472]|uniref:Phosphoribosyl-ATP pyrophosphatase n=1 Tax=Acetobacter estunensis TaxID=104097 RepID=A0A967B7L4_9PROT|nr:phosphoribosyl-ATP pyrophosphatase [Acetobacter estunensis]NHO53651.1 phosphoribosyl-ATP pyrophosphatase [Acetobacter estunensis]GBQ25125.1 phosphoribosyl ATP pyrophosphatase [Acetobacter estunensis NRIC 0472]
MTGSQPGAAATLAPFLERKADGEQPVSPEIRSLRTRTLACELGGEAAVCAAAAMMQDRTTVVDSSARFLEGLVALWKDQGVDPDTIWNELHARIEMGELSLKLSLLPGRPKMARKRPWRVATSKLP